MGAERSPIRETPGRAGSSADKAGTAWYCQTGRVRRAGSDGMREEPVLKLRKRGTGSNLVDMGRDAVHDYPRWVVDSETGLACRRGGHGEGLRRNRGYLKPELGVLAVVAAGVLCAFCCVVDTLSEQCLRRRPGANSLVAAVFRTRWLLRERCSATCPRRRRPGQVRHTQGGLQITTAMLPGQSWMPSSLPTMSGWPTGR